MERQAHAVLPELAALRPTVGATPVIPVPSRAGKGTVWLKMEATNATGSMKARTAYALLCGVVARAGTRAVRLTEYSGGSLALALAEFCGELHLDLHLVVPHGASQRLRRQLHTQGAKVSTGLPGTGFLGAMEAAVRVAAEENRELLLQHCARDVVAMHREHTGAELVDQLRQAGVRPEAFAAAVGSGGSVIGIAQALWPCEPDCRILALFPAEAPYGDPAPPGEAPRMSGTGGLGHGLRQPLLEPHESRIELCTVAYPEALVAMRHLRATHGVAVCGSGAGAWLAASTVVDAAAPVAAAVALIAARGTAEEWAHADAR
ncbi:hypothetical protein ALI144C_31530 [Actinosynnema sp. ALI-1.44]|nr:hypothetical protein ALI144C_31530 [Actinosynnema sp. ALI-1.44]